MFPVMLNEQLMDKWLVGNGGMEKRMETTITWVLPPPLSNSWIITIIWFYIALKKTPNIDCYWVGAIPIL